MTKKTSATLIILLSICCSACAEKPVSEKQDIPVKSGDKLNVVRSLHTAVAAILGEQDMNLTSDTYGGFQRRFTESKRKGSVQYDEAMYVLAWLYKNDPTGKYKGNKKLRDSVLLCGKYLIKRDKPSARWHEPKKGHPNGAASYCDTGFVLVPFAKTYMLLKDEMDAKTQNQWKARMILACSKAGLSHCRGAIANQDSNALLGAYYVWKATGSETARKCYLEKKKELLCRLDRPFGFEWSHVLGRYRSRFYGWDPVYGGVTYSNLAEYYADSKDPDMLPALKKGSEFLKHMILPDGWIQTAVGTRTDFFLRLRVKPPVPVNFFVGAMVMSPFDENARDIAAFYSERFDKAYNLPRDLRLHYIMHDCGNKLVELYGCWRNFTERRPLPFEKKTCFSNYKGNGLVIAKTPAYMAWLSYGPLSPTGGVIADIYDVKNKKHIFVSQGGSPSVRTVHNGFNDIFISGGWESQYSPGKAKVKQVGDKLFALVTGTLMKRGKAGLKKSRQGPPSHCNYRILYGLYQDKIIVHNELTFSAEVKNEKIFNYFRPTYGKGLTYNLQAAENGQSALIKTNAGYSFVFSQKGKLPGKIFSRRAKEKESMFAVSRENDENGKIVKRTVYGWADFFGFEMSKTTFKPGDKICWSYMLSFSATPEKDRAAFGHLPNGFVYGKDAVSVEGEDIIVKPAGQLMQTKPPSSLKPMREIRFPVKSK